MGTLPHLITISICTFIICIVQIDSRPFVNHIRRYQGPFWQNAINNQWHPFNPPWTRQSMEPGLDSQKGLGRPFGRPGMNSMSSSLPSLASRPQLGLTGGHGFGTLTSGWNPGLVAAQIPSLQLGQTLQVGGTASVSSSHLEQMHLVGDSFNPAMANVVFGSGSQYSLTGNSVQQSLNGTHGGQTSVGNIDGGGSQIYQIATMGEVNEVTVMGDSDATGSGFVVQQSFSDSGPEESSKPLGVSNSAGDEEASESMSELLLLEENNEGALLSSASDPLLELQEVDALPESELNIDNANADVAESSNSQQGQVASDPMMELEEPLLQTSDLVEVPSSPPNQHQEVPIEVPSSPPNQHQEVPIEVPTFGISHGSASSIQQPLQSATLSVVLVETDDGNGSPVLTEPANSPDMELVSVPQNPGVPSIADAALLEESSPQFEDKPVEQHIVEEALLASVEIANQQEVAAIQSEEETPIMPLLNIPEERPNLASSLEPVVESQDEISDDVQLTSSSQESADAVEVETMQESQGDKPGLLIENTPQAPIYLLMPLEQLLPVLETLEDQQEQSEIEDEEAEESEVEDDDDDKNDSEEDDQDAIFSDDKPLTPLEISALPATPILEPDDPQQENVIFSDDKPLILTPLEMPASQEELLFPEETPMLETNEPEHESIILSEDKPAPIEDSIPSVATAENQEGGQVDFIDIMSPQDQPLTAPNILSSEETFQSPSETIIIDPHPVVETAATHITSDQEDVQPIMSNGPEVGSTLWYLPSISETMDSEQVESQNTLPSPDLPMEPESNPILAENSPVGIQQELTFPEEEISPVQMEPLSQQHQNLHPLIPNLEFDLPSESQPEELPTSNPPNSASPNSISFPQDQNQSEIELDLEELQEIISELEPDPNDPNQVDDDLEPIITTLNDYLLQLQESEEDTPQISDSSATYLMEDEVESEPPPKGEHHIPQYLTELSGKPVQDTILPLEEFPPNQNHEVIMPSSSTSAAVENSPIEDFDTTEEDDLLMES